MAAPSQIGPVLAPAVAGSGSPLTARTTLESSRTKPVARKTAPAPSLLARFGSVSDLGVPLAVLGIIMAMIMPLPSFVLDILISANITISVIVMLVSMYITRPV